MIAYDHSKFVGWIEDVLLLRLLQQLTVHLSASSVRVPSSLPYRPALVRTRLALRSCSGPSLSMGGCLVST